jgi:regulator of RNase E activity RraA
MPPGRWLAAVDDGTLNAAFHSLSTALIADACVRVGVELRVAPPGMAAVGRPARAAGRAMPVRHLGSVDVFLETLEDARPGDVLVIDNGGRLDEGCIGDLTGLEAQGAGVGAILVWGAHRDGAELGRIDLPIFSYGSCPAGPRGARAGSSDRLESARFGRHRILPDDVAFADPDGALFVPGSAVEEVLRAAESIRRIRQHLRSIGAAVEE